MIFLEDYTLLEEVGQGGFATVYKVRHNRLGYVRAIRVLNSTIAHGESDPLYQKFLNECRLLLCLGNGNHPNIVHIYQPLLKDNKAIVEMDYVDGQDLGSYLNSNGGLVETSDVVRLLTEISSALAYCHEDIYKYCMDRELDDLQDDPNDGSKLLIDEQTRRRLIDKYRVIHNDIHAGNIIRRENGSFVLLDFGLAIEGEEVVRSSRRMNGAPEYMAPEKWKNDGILTPQTDIYSFGVVLYEYLTGRVPFPIDKNETNTDRAIFFVGEAHRGMMPDSIYELRKERFEKACPGCEYIRDFPDWLEDVIMKCLEKNPNDRYASAKELYEDVMDKLAHEKTVQAQVQAPAPAPAPEPVERIKVVDNPEHLATIESLKKEVEALKAKSLEESRTTVHHIDQPTPEVKKSGKFWMWLSVVLLAAVVAIGYMWNTNKAALETKDKEINEVKQDLKKAEEMLKVQSTFNSQQR